MNASRWISTCLLIGLLPLAGCNRSPWVQTSDTDAALKALGNTVPAPEYGREFWQRQHDQKSDAWQQAVKICSESILASYPNCMPVNAIFQADAELRATQQSEKTKHAREMWTRGYDYDKNRRLWFPFDGMIAAGCSYSGEPGARVFDCPPDAKLPKGEK